MTYQTPEERQAARYKRERREENIKLTVAAVAIILALVAGALYGFWWWSNCAMKPYFEAPMLCQVNNNGSPSKK